MKRWMVFAAYGGDEGWSEKVHRKARKFPEEKGRTIWWGWRIRSEGGVKMRSLARRYINGKCVTKKKGL